MLAYRHAFHAGNHGDVLKHLVLLAVLRHLNLKDKGWRYVDTHAGAGGYSLQGTFARKKAEYVQGISLVRAHASGAPPLVADYLERVREFNGGDALRQYPGSPALAHAMQRPQDQLSLFELHPTDHRVLSSYLGKQAGCEVRMSDGFEGLKSRLPPPTRRGLVLMDPSYELDRDYALVVATVRESLQRFADGTYVVWYPQVSKVQAAQLPKRLRNLTTGAWLHARLTVARPDARGFGMSGSGVFVFNPPHTLHAQLKTVLPWLHGVLKQFDDGGFLLEHKAD